MLYEVKGRADDALGVEAVVVEYLGAGTVNDILVGDADDADGNRVLGECLADHGTEAAVSAVLLYGDDAVGVTGGTADGVFVEGLNPGAVEHTGGNALLSELQGGLISVPDGLAGGHDGEVLAVAELDSFAYLEVEVIVFIDIWNGGTSYADIGSEY